MRLATVVTENGARLHVRAADGYVDVARATGRDDLASLTGLLASGSQDDWNLLRSAAEREGRSVDESELGPAVPAPRRILCLGVNSADHAAEGGRPLTTWPEVFVRGADSVAPPYAALVKPALSERFDYEGELGVVIGRGGRYIPAGEAMTAIAGVVVCMDGPARDWQRAAPPWPAGPVTSPARPPSAVTS